MTRLLFTALLLAAPLSAQHIAASNQSDKTPLNTLAVWEEAVAVIHQAEGLHDALSSGEYNFDISADACESIRAQQRSGLPPALPDPIPNLGTNTDECEVRLTEEYVKEALHGWQYDFPASTGDDHTVCASGCDGTNIQTVYDGAACGDTVTLEAGETWNLGTNSVELNKPCPLQSPITIRSSEHAQFVVGERVTPADASLMPKLMVSPNASAFDFEPTYIAITAVDSGSDEITVAGHGLSVGDPVHFTSDATEPLDNTRTYYVRSVDGDEISVSRYPRTGYGPALEILGSASGSLVLPASAHRIAGIYIEPNVAGDHSDSLIDLGDDAQVAAGANTHHILMEHLLILGVFNQETRRGVKMSGRYATVRDSHIAGIMDNSDSQAVWITDGSPHRIENNYLEASGENIMIGGSLGANQNEIPGLYGSLVTKGNWLRKPFAWKSSSVAGTPTEDPCAPGEMHRNTSGAPDYYKCDSDGLGWTLQPDGDEFADTTTTIKNVFELKKALHWQNTGNVYENSWNQAQTGYILVLTRSDASQNGYRAEIRDGHMYGEIAKNAAAFQQHSTIDKDLTPGINMGNNVFSNMLVFGLDKELYDNGSGTAGSQTRFAVTNIGRGGWSVNHLTVLPRVDPEGANFINFTQYNGADFITSEIYRIKDSVLGLTTVFSSNGSAGCPSLTGSSDALDIRSLWAWTDGAGPNLDSCAGTQFYETDLDDIGFDSWSGGTDPDDFRITSAGTTCDYRAGGACDAADGKDQGADIDIVKDLTGGAEAGLLSWSEQHGVAITAAGSTTATVEWDRPNASNSCNFYLYTDYARTAEHADTSGDNGDNRDGGVSAGHVTFALGVNSALTTKTWYWFEIDCPTDEVLMVGSLMTN